MNLLPLESVIHVRCWCVKQREVKKNSLAFMCGLFRDPLSFSQTCCVSAGLMQACPRALSRISIFFLRSALQHFLFSVSGSDSRPADGQPLAAFDSENVFFSSQLREVVAERRTG